MVQGRDLRRRGPRCAGVIGNRCIAVGALLVHRYGLVPQPGVSRRAAVMPPQPRVAILLAMSVADHMPLAELKNRLSEVVDRLEREHGRIVITKHGRPAAVVLSIEDLESLEETLDVMGNRAVLDDIQEALAELETGAAAVLNKDDALRIATGR